MSTFQNGHALLIGVGADLPNTVDDAKGLARILADPERCAYPEAQVVSLTGPGAARDQVLAALDALAARSDASATVIVFFSGHGYQAVSSMGEQYYLMPYGYDLRALFKTAISGAEFTAKLQAIPAGRMLVLLDCCHAGGVGEGEKSPGLELTKAPLPTEAASLFAKGAGRVMIASSRADEKSFAGRPYSAFTLALIEALSGAGASRRDGYVRWTDLALHAREKVPQRTKDRQHPIVDLDQADNFVLAYYAAGAAEPKGLPFSGEPEIEDEPGAFRGMQVNTGGGAFVGGSVRIGRGDFVGRDKIVHGDEVRGAKLGGDEITAGNVSGTGVAIGHGASARVQQGLSGADLDRAFAALAGVLAAARPEVRAEAGRQIEELKREVGKGDKADDTRMAKLIDGLVGLVPAAIGAVASIFATPILGGIAGNATKYVLEKIQRP